MNGRNPAVSYNPLKKDGGKLESLKKDSRELESLKSQLLTVYDAKVGAIGSSNAGSRSSLQQQHLTRNYLAACKSVDDFVNDANVYKPWSPTIFIVAVTLVAVVFVLLALGVSWWSASVSPYFDLSAESFFGWVNEPNAFMTAKNLYCGLMLGTVFGFLDNLGLFAGMEYLDPPLYMFATQVVVGLHADPSRADAHETHAAATDLMSGLGNTFSDIVGVALGTAVLEAAKAGLSTDPAFWPLDLLAMLVGCLLGCFVPALIKHSHVFDRGGNARFSRASTLGWFTVVTLLMSIVFVAIPEADTDDVGGDWTFWASLTCMLVATAVLCTIVCKKRSVSECWKALGSPSTATSSNLTNLRN